MLATARCWHRRCLHYIGVVHGENHEGDQKHVCNAFPDGIPDEIAYGDNDHMEPVKGDDGLVYERFQGTDREYAGREATKELGNDGDLIG